MCRGDLILPQSLFFCFRRASCLALLFLVPLPNPALSECPNVRTVAYACLGCGSPSVENFCCSSLSLESFCWILRTVPTMRRPALGAWKDCRLRPSSELRCPFDCVCHLCGRRESRAERRLRHNILQYENRMKTNTEFYSFQNSHCFICWFVAAPSLPNDMAWSLRTAPDLQKHCSGLIV